MPSPRTTLYYLLLIALLCFAGTAQAQTAQRVFTLGVAYTLKSKQAVLKFQKEIASVPQLNNAIVLKTYAVTDDSIPCYNPPNSRLLTCNKEEEFLKFKNQNSLDGFVAFTHLASGGKGSTDVSVVGGEAYYKNALHEFLHQIGFDDEYRYDGIDSGFGKYKCSSGQRQNSVNVIYQDFSKLRFSSEQQARTYLALKIPWVRLIPSYVKIVKPDGTLGTPIGVYPPGTLGLFRGGGCDKYVSGWVAQEHSVMNKNTDLPLKAIMTPYYTNLIRQALKNKLANPPSFDWSTPQRKADNRTFDQIKNGTAR